MTDLTREALLRAAQGGFDADVAAFNAGAKSYWPVRAAVDAVLSLLADDAERLGAHAVRLFPEQSLALIRYADRLRALGGER